MENNHHEPSAVRPEEEEVILPTEEPMTETPSVQEEETAAVSDETNETNQANETDETNETDENAAVPIEKIFEDVESFFANSNCCRITYKKLTAEAEK